MNIKEKILFIASQEYVNKLHEQNLDFENHNRLFWCHLSCLFFLTTGIKEVHLDLNYLYLISTSKNDTKQNGLIIDFNGISFYTTNNALIQFNNRCTRNSLRLNNPIIGKNDCFSFKNSVEEYINKNVKFKEMIIDDYHKYPFNLLFFKFKINNRKSTEEQQIFLNFIHEQCPEIDYFLNYIKHKEKFSTTNNKSEKKIKI